MEHPQENSAASSRLTLWGLSAKRGVSAPPSVFNGFMGGPFPPSRFLGRKALL